MTEATLGRRQNFLARVMRMHDRSERNVRECRQRLNGLRQEPRTWFVRRELRTVWARLVFMKKRVASRLNMIRIVRAEIAELREQLRVARNFVDLSGEPDE
jgi:hypothetical protein